jgi:hypothetical protein
MFFSFTGYPPSLAAILAIGNPRPFPAIPAEPGKIFRFCPRSADAAPKTAVTRPSEASSWVSHQCFRVRVALSLFETRVQRLQQREHHC